MDDVALLFVLIENFCLNRSGASNLAEERKEGRQPHPSKEREDSHTHAKEGKKPHLSRREEEEECTLWSATPGRDNRHISVPQTLPYRRKSWIQGWRSAAGYKRGREGGIKQGRSRITVRRTTYSFTVHWNVELLLDITELLDKIMKNWAYHRVRDTSMYIMSI